MRVMHWAIAPYATSFSRPLATAHGVWRAREGAWVLCAAGGRIGLGEVAPLTDWGTESQEAAIRALWTLGPVDLTGVDSPWAIVERLEAAGLSRSETPAAFAGAELALLDWWSGHSGQPLARAFGPAPRTDVRLNALVAGPSPEAAAAEALAACEAGYRCLKLKLGARSLADDQARIAAVRRAIGPAIALRLDANAAWQPEAALAFLQAVAPEQVDYIEQPLPADDLAGMAWLRERSPIRLAADEAIRSLATAEAVLRHGAADVLILKPAALGGLAASWEIATRARAQGAEVIVSSALDRGVATLGALHLAAALPGGAAHGLAPSDRLAQAIALPAAGTVTLPPAPGLGAVPTDPDLIHLVEMLRHDSATTV